VYRGAVMTTRGVFGVEIGFQVYLEEGGEEIGAVRQVAHDHVVVYIEGAREFTIPGPAVRAAHDGKLVLDPKKVDPALLEAARHAHERETE
jgi:hypothetical protein